MSEHVEHSSILQRLDRIRGMVRCRLVACGLCVVLAAGVASFLAILVFDWLLVLPAVLRILVTILFLAAFVGACLHWIGKPIQTDFGRDEIAGKLEQHFGSFQDRLSSAVNFIERKRVRRTDGDSVRLMEQTIANTDRLMQDVPLESALSLRPLIVRGLCGVLSVAVLAAVLTVSPGWAQTGLYRYVYPFGEIEWPRRVSIVPLTGMETVAVGESVTLRMQVERGLRDGLRGVVHLRNREGDVISLALQRGSNGRFHATVDVLTEDLEYWFEAGDASTERHPYTIRVVRRPAVVEALATIEPPPYASGRPARTHDLNEGPVNAPVGGHVTINIRASKPIPPSRAADLGPRGLEIGESETRDPRSRAPGLRVKGHAGESDGERFVPLVGDPEDPHRLSTQFEVTDDMHFRIELRGAEGFANRGAAQHSILAIPDGPPEVTVLEPKAVTEVTPYGVIPLVVRVKDDFGITHLTLHAEQAGDGEEDCGLGIADCGLRRDSEWPIAIGESALPQSIIDDGVGKIVEYTWDLEPMAVSPGDTVVYHAWAVDNCPGAGEDGQIGRSASLRLRIISELEFDVRVRDELALLEKRIRDIALDEAGLLDATRELVEVREGILAPAVAPAGDLSARQARLIRRVRYLASRFAQLGRRMKANLAARPEAPKPIDRAGESLREVAGGPMTRASGALAEMGDRLETGPTAEQQQALLRETLREQEAALDRLHALIRTMSQWGNFEWLVSKTRDLIDRQEAIRQRTASLGKTMLGKSVDSLTTTEATALTREQRRQEQVTTDVEELLSRMGRLLLEAREKDPSGGEAIDAALRAARARNVTGRLRAAGEAIGLNRTAAAVIDQKAGAEGIRKMLRALRERDRRELAELRKRLQRAEDQVAMLIDQQRALRSATHEAALLTEPRTEWNPDLSGARAKTRTSAEGAVDDEALGSLEQEQHRLTRNTRSVSDELADTDQAAYAARRLRMTEVPMGEAEEYLRDKNPGAATPEQDEALEMLEDALAWLEELARLTEEQNLRRSLAQIREDLQAIRTAQNGVNEGVDELHEAVKARGRIKRFEAREAARLARQQAEVRMLLDEVLPDLLKVPVYEWALRRVADWMDSCRGRLDARRVDEQLVVSAGRIVRELDKLISAIVETESLPVDTEFADAGGGGGGQGSPATSTPVPTVAELFVLKAMQEEINGRTRELYESLDLDAATEQQLRELRFVGEDQAQVRHLTDLVTKRARHP